MPMTNNETKLNQYTDFATLGQAMAEASANGDRAEIARIKAIMRAKQSWRTTPEWQDLLTR